MRKVKLGDRECEASIGCTEGLSQKPNQTEKSEQGARKGGMEGEMEERREGVKGGGREGRKKEIH